MNKSPRCTPDQTPTAAGPFISARFELIDHNRAMAITHGRVVCFNANDRDLKAIPREIEIGIIHKNSLGFWISDTCLGVRYYSNPLPAAFDMAIAKTTKILKRKTA